MIDIKVPTVGESINEVTLLKWTKNDGDYVERDEVIAELESEKATFEVNAEKAGVLKTAAKEGDTLHIGDVLASIDEAAAKPEKPGVKSEELKVETKAEAKKEVKTTDNGQRTTASEQRPADVKASPVASAIIADKKVNPSTITPSGSGGKILKDDVLSALNNPGKKPGVELFGRNEKSEKMSNLRKKIGRAHV